MKQYFLKNGTRESGPYILDDLKYQRITSSSLIKIDGGNWEPISKNPDLHFLLQSHGSSSGSTVVDNRNRSDSNPSAHGSQAKSRVIVVVAIAIFFAMMGVSIAFFFAAGK